MKACLAGLHCFLGILKSHFSNEIVCCSGRFLDDAPARIVYCPGVSFHESEGSSKTVRRSRLTVTVACFDSPGARSSLTQPTRRLGGSPTDSGKDA